jgi:thiamine pyrophosphokinase
MFLCISTHDPLVKVGLVLNGETPSRQDLDELEDCQEIVCADGAARHLLKADKVPSIIVGDLDSLEPEVYKWVDAMGIPLERHPRDKDYTDGELALQTALKYDPDHLIIIGGHGGRSSMFMANLKILRRAHDAGVDAVMLGRGETLRYVDEGEDLDLSHLHGQTFNVLPIGGDAVVTIQGALFEGERIELRGASARGVSNVVDKEGPSRVETHEGLALVIIESDPDQ